MRPGRFYVVSPKSSLASSGTSGISVPTSSSLLVLLSLLRTVALLRTNFSVAAAFRDLRSYLQARFSWGRQFASLSYIQGRYNVEARGAF